ncbi:hypothetical protein [Glycomyces albidus]|jgi:hypothetical protein|uniref:Secreted protein n=1 Tax=Glycomyces albidus TaxID=2656774 RepID=A0A6L5G9R1_9ACTN|nr:hypothetical protein [Glycomyces albidus]MQM26313.1 hypothetical protein [Glycomyces albidus]
MRNTTMAAVSAAAAAAAFSGDAAQASTPDWLTLAAVETGHDSVLPSVCETGTPGAITGPACDTVLGSLSANEWTGAPLPELHESDGGVRLVDIDLRNFATWKVCGVAVGASTRGAHCDNSIQDQEEPVNAERGNALVNADATGALQWSVCGVSVGEVIVVPYC